MAGLAQFLTLVLVSATTLSGHAAEKKPPKIIRPRKPVILAPPGDSTPTVLDLQLLISQLDTAEREPARELLNGYRLSFDAIQPNRLLIHVETRGLTDRTPREPMERAIREKIGRARQLAREQGGQDVHVSVWINGERAPDLSDPDLAS